MTTETVNFDGATTIDGSLTLSGSDNIAFGYEAGQVYYGPGGWTDVDTSRDSSDAPSTFWHCAYCGQSNAAEREGCRGCQAPRGEVA